MGDSVKFYTIFYSVIDKTVDSIIASDILSKLKSEDRKQYIVNVSNTLYSSFSSDILIQIINNDLTLYLDIIKFVKEKEKPFMPFLLDFTNLNAIFNRFCYHYAKLCINDECIFENTIFKKIISII